MSSDTVSLICWYNDTVTVDITNNPKDVNGIVKHVMVRKSITLCELVEKFHRITKINSNKHQINLICNWPITQEYFIVVPIADDDNTEQCSLCTLV